MKGCTAYNCTNYQGKYPNVKFHRYPNPELEPDRYAKWIHAVRRINFKPSKHAVLCSVHFKNSDYLESSLRQNLLKKDAVPSVFNFPDLNPTTDSQRVSEETVKEETMTIDSDETSEIFAEPLEPLYKEISVQTDDELVAAFAKPTYKEISAQTELTMAQLQNTLKMHRHKIKLLQQQLNRREYKIKNIKETLRKSKEKVPKDIDSIMVNNFSGFPLELFKNEMINNKTAPSNRRYSDEMKNFSLSLLYYSQPVYEFLRKKLCLPDPATLRGWVPSEHGKQNSEESSAASEEGN